MPGAATNEALKAAGLFDVSHITALVTGGATGIGLMITQALVSNGAKVYIVSRRQEVLEKTVELYNTGPGSLHAIVGDVSSKVGAVKLAEELGKKESGGIQLLVNNAGIARDDNTKFLAFLPLLAKGSSTTPGYSSSVINVSSISGAMKGSSMGQFAYASSKAASTHLSRMLALAFKDVKVRVNVIAPGVFPSEMTTGSSHDDNKSSMDMDSTNPAGRKGMDSDMAATVLFLAGKGGVFYNEQILYPDGGVTLSDPSVK
ncbi:Rhamnolipids biosynthesis 3-oxoacyl-[acyl-carrier-protein] reductase [Pseudocercospora fuligena]|uniref:Rhamnolipids biosynthesis 3-oxoacyl-[acyl-carrier-protein] reductase n=1 Tax=Pseudocercospora fuligena TaxID=685502 RepID=A0A8H6RFH6_9PEZI|nr:Rhamnolipids biosynthesis 3-oxoacyl-[acyl-carrier-protein] reductase [Pseudocercospora fuligena]